MSTIHGFMDGSYDYKQMYNIQDLKGPLPKPVIYEDTILGAMAQNPDVSQFFDMVTKSRLSATLNSVQGDFTIFVPVNNGIPDCYLDSCDYKNRQIILLHMLEHAVPLAFIKGSRAMFVNTRLTGSRLLIENEIAPLPLINRSSQVLGYKLIGNGIIYFIDKMILPEDNPLSNVSI